MDPEIALELNDGELLGHLFRLLNQQMIKASPYGQDSTYAVEIQRLPVGLRAMAATNCLDVSLTLDDLGWHFGNFGEPGLVRETELGLRELGLDDLANWFAEAHQIREGLQAEIEAADDYYQCIEQHGVSERLRQLDALADGLHVPNEHPALESAIYRAWIRYTRRFPEKVFPPAEPAQAAT